METGDKVLFGKNIGMKINTEINTTSKKKLTLLLKGSYFE